MDSILPFPFFFFTPFFMWEGKEEKNFNVRYAKCFTFGQNVQRVNWHASRGKNIWRFIAIFFSAQVKRRHTSLATAFFPLSSPWSYTYLRAPGRTFQNSFTNSLPLRLLFCKISFAKYRNETRCSFCDELNNLSHVSTICLAFFRWEMHHFDKANLISKINRIITIAPTNWNY